MFGDLMGNIEKQQMEMQKRLALIPVEVEIEGIKVIGNGTKAITNLEIEANLIHVENKEMLEDILLTAVNRFVEQAALIESREAQSLMGNMLPPGFEDMFK